MNQQNTIEIRDETHLGIRDSEGEAPEESFSSPWMVPEQITLLENPSREKSPDR